MPNRRPKQVNSQPPHGSQSDAKSKPEPESTDLAQQFELELQWCIQQLQGALSANKMNPRQAQDTSRSLNVLRSKTAPMVKKRQVMRTSFGDYRAKMAEEEKKLTRVQKKVSIAASSPNRSSRFVKKSSVIMSERTDNSFRFGFQTPEEKKEDVEPQHASRSSTMNFTFTSSDNSFRFGFEQSEVAT